MESMLDDPDEITIITIKRSGTEVFTEVNHVKDYKPVDPQAIVGVCAGVISEYNKYLVSCPELEE